MGLTLAHATRTDVGRVRADNEDALFASDRLVAVADGVGGHAAGEVASRAALDELVLLDKSRVEGPLPAALAAAVSAGNARIGFIAECRPRLAGMSTTLTAVALDEAAADYAVANIGDSRTYLLRDGVLTRLTRDDSWVQALVDRGVLAPEDVRTHPRRSVVVEVLDGRPERAATVVTRPAYEGDRLLLCSDGLSDFVDDDAIRAALAIPDREAAADRLLALALDAGGRDNVSVIVADVVRSGR